MLTNALPVANRCGGRSAVAVDKIVGSVSPTPIPNTIVPGSIRPM